MRGGLLAALLCTAVAGWWPTTAPAAGPRQRLSPAAAQGHAGPGQLGPARVTQAQASPARAVDTGATGEPSALVVFVAPGPLHHGNSEDDAIEAELSSIPALSTGILSATQGTYKTAQLLLDVTQGARVSYSAYSPAYPPALSLTALGRSGGGQVQPWAAVLKRADDAPQLLDPGLLAASIPSGAAYAGIFGSGDTKTSGTVASSTAAGGVETSDTKASSTVAGGAETSDTKASSTAAGGPHALPGIVSIPANSNPDGPLAANRSGKIAAVSLGAPATLLARIAELRATHSLVVADLPSGAPGSADLRTLAATRPASELLIVIQRAPSVPGHELLWSAFAGLGPGGDTLTSQTTNQRGMIAAIDIGPTILEHLGLSIPADMRGKPVRLDGAFDGASLRALKARLVVIDSRRLPAFAWLMLAWALLLTAVRLPVWRGNRRRRSAWAIRSGAIAMLWSPVAVLVPAALEPSRTVELAVIVATCFLLGALTDRLLPWPRAPLVPAAGAVIALTVDALAGTQLLMRSLLGPSPAFGARFYGIGNELKSGLAVLVFSAVAAALYPAVRSRRAAATMAGTGIVLAIVEGSARIGAGVGGVILVSAGAAVGTVMLLPGTLNRKRVLIVMAAPVVGLIALAAIDLATAHGSGHFTGSVLDARSPGDIRDIVVRRYTAAWDELKNHLMPVATALALLASIFAVRNRDRVLAPVSSDPVWLAALAGGLTSGVIGALTEDSGPVLLVVAVLALGCVLSYLWASPTIELARPSPAAPTNVGATAKQSTPVAFK